MNCFLVFLSLTQTQCAADALRRSGMSVSMVRPPLSLGKGSCSYALMVSRDRLKQTLSVLARTGLHPIVYQVLSDGRFQEVKE